MGNVNSEPIKNDDVKISKYVNLIYESDLYVKNLYDLKSLEILDVNLLYEILQDDLHYHATSGCNAISILKNGWKFQDEVEKMGVNTLDQYLGHGLYFSEHIEKSMQYGNYVFIVKIDFEKYNQSDICLIPAMDHFSFVEYRHKHWDKINNSKMAIYEGLYDKYGQSNLYTGIQDGPIKDYYTELRIRDKECVELLYLIELETPQKHRMQTFNLVPSFRQMSCMIDLHNQHIILPNTLNDLTQIEILSKYWYSYINFIDILKYIKTKQLNNESIHKNLIKITNVTKNSWDIRNNYILIGDLILNNKKISTIPKNTTIEQLSLLPKYMCIFNKSEYR